MQDLWALQFHWDERIPEDKLKEWIEFHESLKFMNDFKIHRFLLSEEFGILLHKGAFR